MLARGESRGARLCGIRGNDEMGMGWDDTKGIYGWHWGTQHDTVAYTALCTWVADSTDTLARSLLSPLHLPTTSPSCLGIQHRVRFKDRIWSVDPISTVDPLSSTWAEDWPMSARLSSELRPHAGTVTLPSNRIRRLRIRYRFPY